MTTVLLDTHVWAWSFHYPSKLSNVAKDAIQGADATYVSPITFYEVAFKQRLGKWPEMDGLVDRLFSIADEQGVILPPVSAEITFHAAQRDWDHRDPFDRIIASTAELMDLPLVTKDPAFDTLRSIRCIW
ncbi:MAG: type II toxin-antitoxin system VapC family toxin [Pseudomonadota bacterium]